MNLGLLHGKVFLLFGEVRTHTLEIMSSYIDEVMTLTLGIMSSYIGEVRIHAMESISSYIGEVRTHTLESMSSYIGEIRPRWLSWMRRPTGDQEVAGSTPAEVGNILWWRLIMKYFLRSFSPFGWFKKGSCQFLAKECAQYWLTA